MEFEALSENRRSSIGQHLFPAVAPVLFIAISYVDPGKWAAAVDGGARFGFDLVLPVLIFNFAAILCQYLSARIAVVTGRDLGQICSEEYDKVTCIFLGVQAEVSMIALDLMMVLGAAHGLNVLFGIDLFTGVFLTTLNAFLFPLLATLLESSKAKFVSIYISIVILLLYVFGVFISQPGSTLFMGGTTTRLSGESAFALMSLLGANIMPHNFYLHSSIVQQDQGPTNVSKEALCQGHFFAILCIFSGIFLVNYVLMSSAANVFNGLVLLTFQDALSLLDQVSRSSITPLSLILLMFLSSQVTALTWNVAGQVVVRDLFKVDIPGWLHYATIRIIAIIPALYCVWNSGAEGIYQLLIFTQVVVSLMLPSSVIPLFRVASSRPLMGIYKVSQFEEFLALISFIGMLGLKIVFFIELVFGSCDWVSNLRWNIGSSVPIAYVILLVAASVSFCLMLWLAATPLKSATSRIDPQVLDWDIHSPVPESSIEGEQNDACVSKYKLEKHMDEQELPVTFEKSLGSHPDLSTSCPNFNLPDTLFESENVIHPRSVEDNKSEIAFSSAAHTQEKSPAIEGEINLVKSNHSEVSDSETQNARPLETQSTDLEEKTLRIEGDRESVKDDADSWDPEEPTREVPESNQSLASEGPGSFRSLSGKSDDVGSGTGSLSRLALGRAARRQFAAVLDEFWGQMFDFHGQATQEAKARKVDVLLGLDVKLDTKTSSPSVMTDNTRQDFTGYFRTLSIQGSDSLMNSSLYSAPRQQVGQGIIESSFGVKRRSSPLWSSHVQFLDENVRNSSRNTFDSGERRYSSMHIPASSNGYDQQPATVQGYELASYLNQIAKERGSGFSSGQNELPAPKSTSSVSSNFRDSVARPVVKKPLNGMSTLTPPGFHNISVSRNNSLQSERSSYDVSSPKPAENLNSSVNAKKFYSLPDISGLRVPYRDSALLDKSGKWENSVKYGQSGGSSPYDRISLNASSRPEVPPGFGDHSPSKVCRDAFSLQINSGSSTGSLWSRQPYEQFGVAGKTYAEGEQIKVSYTPETPSTVDLEAKILQSFRYSVMKLLKLEGSDWLFRQNDGADEDLIDRVAAREKFLYEAESVQMNWPSNAGEGLFYSESKLGSAVKSDDTDYTKFLVTSVPHCGEGCVYKIDLIISFGVWCIHRVLELSLMESRPELWGKYTYVLNRLQGIIDMAFFRSRSPMTPCFCLELPSGWQQKSSPPISNGGLPPHAKQGRGKCTTAASLLDIIKDVEIAISCRKGRTGTAAGDVAFPKGKENLASVLKRYKRRLANKPIGSQDGGSGSRKVSSTLHYGL